MKNTLVSLSYLLLTLSADFVSASSPVYACIDDTYFAYKGVQAQNCGWVGQDTYTRCGLIYNGSPVYESCPVTCNECLVPTKAPTKKPTRKPTKSPTRAPTKLPTRAPTMPSYKPPTKPPTKSPTRTPPISYENPTPTGVNSVVVGMTCYVSGETISIKFFNEVNPMRYDWVGIYPSSSNPQSLPSGSRWMYLCGDQTCSGIVSHGTVFFNSAKLTPGHYKAFLVHDGTSPYQSYAKSVEFVIKDSYSSC